MELFNEHGDSQNGVIWTQYAFKNIKKALVKKLFALLEKLCKILYKTNGKWSLSEAFLRQSLKKHPKALRL